MKKSAFYYKNTPLLLPSLMFFAFFFLSACTQNIPTKLAYGYRLPSLKLPNIASDSVAIADVKNKVILVEFWASWCKPCRIKHPELDRIRQKYNTTPLRGGKQGFEIYYVSLDDDAQTWQNAIQKDGIAAWQYHLADLVGMKKSEIPKQFNFEKVPTAYLIDEDGIIIGIDLSEERLEYELSLRVLEDFF